MDSVLSCYWRLYLKGKEIDLARRQCISSIQDDEICDGSDTITITIHDPDYLFINDNIFVEEVTVKYIQGFNEFSYKKTFTGYVATIDIDFPENGYPVMSIMCMDGSHVMNRKKKKKSWDNVTNADIVRKKAKEYGFKVKIQAGYSFKREDTITQSNQTDIDFLEGLAGSEREPFICKLVGNTLHYVKKGLLSASVSTVGYRTGGMEVVSFSPQINKETRQVESASADIEAGNKKVDKHVASDTNTKRDTQGSPVKTGEKKTENSSSNSSSTKNKKYNVVTRQWE